MSYISSDTTREQFLENIYNKSKSDASKDLAKTALGQFDLYCQDIFKKENADEILGDIKKEGENDHSSDKVLIFLNSFIQWLGKDHPDLQVGTGHKNSPFRPMRARIPYTIH